MNVSFVVKALGPHGRVPTGTVIPV